MRTWTLKLENGSLILTADNLYNNTGSISILVEHVAPAEGEDMLEAGAAAIKLRGQLNDVSALLNQAEQAYNKDPSRMLSFNGRRTDDKHYEAAIQAMEEKLHLSESVIENLRLILLGENKTKKRAGYPHIFGTLSQGVIGDSLFFSKKDLLSIEVPEGVNTIGMRAFAWCTALQGVTLPTTLATIEQEGLSHTAITEIEFKANKETIAVDRWAFGCCKHLNRLKLTGASEATKILIHEQAFLECPNLQVQLPSGSSYELVEDKSWGHLFQLTLPAQPKAAAAPDAQALREQRLGEEAGDYEVIELQTIKAAATTAKDAEAKKPAETAFGPSGSSQFAASSDSTSSRAGAAAQRPQTRPGR